MQAEGYGKNSCLLEEKNALKTSKTGQDYTEYRKTNKKHLTPGCENQGIEQSSKVAASYTHTHTDLCVCVFTKLRFISALCVHNKTVTC